MMAPLLRVIVWQFSQVSNQIIASLNAGQQSGVGNRVLGLSLRVKAAYEGQEK
jgi:hypothetical protein